MQHCLGLSTPDRHQLDVAQPPHSPYCVTAVPKTTTTATDGHVMTASHELPEAAVQPPSGSTTHEASPPSLEEMLQNGRQRVRSLGEAMQWIWHFAMAVQRQWGLQAKLELLRRLIVTLSTTSVISMFSGIDAPGTALELICEWLARETGQRVKVPHIAGIEMFSESQNDRTHPSACLRTSRSFSSPPSGRQLLT